MGCSKSKQSTQPSKTMQHITRWDSMSYDDVGDDVMSLNRLFADVDDRPDSPLSISDRSSMNSENSEQKACVRNMSGLNNKMMTSDDKKVRFETTEYETDDTCLLQNYDQQELIEKKRRSFLGDMKLYRQAIVAEHTSHPK